MALKLRTILPVLLAAGALSACSSVETTTLSGKEAQIEASQSQARAMPIHGIDVSKYQGAIDWPTVARSGVRFAWLKATEGGDRTDDAFATNWNGARAAGIPTGAYHFYYFCRPVEDQIAWFKTHVPPAPDALPPVLDMEWNPQSPTCKLRPPAERIKADMRVFLHEMERFYGKKPIIYTTVDFHRDVMPDDMDEYRFWVRSVAAHPTTRYGKRSLYFWQYTATGRVDGVPTQVDRNVFMGSEKDWQAFLGEKAGAATQVAQQAPMPAPQPAPALAYAPSPAAPKPAAVAGLPAPLPLDVAVNDGAATNY